MTQATDDLDERLAAIRALHRGFREIDWPSSTPMTAWERPLPNQTWSRQPIEKVKGWLEEGGFPWEVEAAKKKAAKRAAAIAAGKPAPEDEED